MVTPFMNLNFFDIVRCIFSLISSFGGIFKVFLLKFEVFLGFCIDFEGFFFDILVDFKSVFGILGLFDKFFFWIFWLIMSYGYIFLSYMVAPLSCTFLIRSATALFFVLLNIFAKELRSIESSVKLTERIYNLFNAIKTTYYKFANKT